MNVQAGVRFGPVICRVDNIEDCRPAARLIRARLRHIPQIVFMDAMGNVHLAPGYQTVPPDAVRWMVGTYNVDATINAVASDLASEIRERRLSYRGVM
jgi:hypothetical protein